MDIELESFLNAFTLAHSAPVEYRRRYQTNFIRDRTLNTVNFLVGFARIAFNLEKVGPTFSSLNGCPSLPSAATDDRKQFQSLNIALNNITGLLF